MEYIGNIELDEKLHDKELVIYGTGKVAVGIYKFLKNNNLYSGIKCFCVSDTEKISNGELDNIKILKLSEAYLMFPEAEYLIGGKFVCQMLDELRNKGVEKIHLLFI